MSELLFSASFRPGIVYDGNGHSRRRTYGIGETLGDNRFRFLL